MTDASTVLRARLDPRARQGAFVAVVGPSGAGKDTLMSYARGRLSGEDGHAVHFVRRVITRAPDGGTEDHDALSVQAFLEAKANGAFALSWVAHGLHYGLPAVVDDRIAAGATVVANLSRTAIPALRARYRNVAVAFVTAAPAIRAARLAARGRETREEILARLSRAAAGEDEIPAPVTVIQNDDTLEAGGAALVAAIRMAGELARAPLDL
ncbi:MAG: phosphonate metabolism protein/1,5-bisphosphokinase (PRPP-forming) PhnN [Nitratireductor sp.]